MITSPPRKAGDGRASSVRSFDAIEVCDRLESFLLSGLDNVLCHGPNTGQAHGLRCTGRVHVDGWIAWLRSCLLPVRELADGCWWLGPAFEDKRFQGAIGLRSR